MEHSLNDEQKDDSACERGRSETWLPPELLRLGSVTSLTSKVDNRGRNDGGRFPRRRT